MYVNNELQRNANIIIFGLVTKISCFRFLRNHIIGLIDIAFERNLYVRHH